MCLFMSEGVKFVTGSSLASTPFHFNYSHDLSWDWTTTGCHTTWSKICVGDGGAF